MLAALALVLSCRTPPAAVHDDAATPARSGLVAVNGHEIYQEDVDLAASAPGHKADEPVRPEIVLETVVRQELAAQRAEALGLDADPEYQKKIRRAEAGLAAARRRDLAALYYKQAAAASAVTEADAQAYFLANQARISTEVYVLQILSKDDKRIEAAEAKLKSGVLFEKVASEPFASLPPSAGKPWDLGWLRWSQVPEAWVPAVYDMAVGSVSGVIHGTGGRSWIIQVVDRRTDPKVDFAAARTVLMEVLEGRRRLTAREDAEKGLRDGANIVYSTTEKPSLPPAGDPAGGPMSDEH